MIKIIQTLLLTALASSAFANEAAPNPINSMALMGLMFVLVYFIMIRPQNKKQKEHKQMLENVSVGDEIVTTGGILGKVAKASNEFFTLNVSQGVDIVIKKASISQVLPVGTIKSI